MADLDDQPAELSELDLSESTAIDGEDVEKVLGGNEGESIVKADPDRETADEDEDV